MNPAQRRLARTLADKAQALRLHLFQQRAARALRSNVLPFARGSK